jgi:DNA polymerase-3 subunit epsilon
VNPEVPIPADATALHGITDAMVRDAPTIAAALPGLLAFLGTGPAVAHHALYDVQRLTFEAQRVGVALPGTIPVHCSIDASRVAFPDAPSRGLLNLARTLGLEREGAAHRAAGDAALVVQLMLRCVAAVPRDVTDYAPAVGTL